MKSILMSIKPKWVEKIASGEKTVEVRKSVPKCGTPFKVYIYETLDGGHSCKRCKETSETCYSWAKSGVGCYNGSGTVVGEFVCDKIERLEQTIIEGGLCYTRSFDFLEQTMLDNWELSDYGKGAPIYGLHISDLKIYDKPKALSEFATLKKCNSCKVSGYESSACCYDEKCVVPSILTRPPQSWCYVEELV